MVGDRENAGCHFPTIFQMASSSGSLRLAVVGERVEDR